MILSNEGLTLWWGTPDAPAPTESGAARTGAILTIGVRPASPVNTVSVRFRVDGGFVQTIPTTAIRFDYEHGAHYFRATFPRMPSGEIVEFLPILSCAGRQVPAATQTEHFPGRFQLASATVMPTQPAQPAPPSKSQQRFIPDLEFLACVSIDIDKGQVIGETPEGLLINFFALEGTVRGPRICGKVLPRSADNLMIRRDGVGVINVHAVIETDDGATISAEYYGSLDLGPDGYQQTLAGHMPRLPTAHTAPRLVTGHLKYQWVNRLQCLGVGRVDTKEQRYDYDLFALRQRPVSPK